MRRRGVLTAALLAAAIAAAPAHAQPTDPIDALLQSQADADEPDTAAASAPPPPPAHRPPATPANLAPAEYDTRLRASSAAARSFQGPLEGGWTLRTPEGDVFALQLVDDGQGRLEGAWRDLRKTGALDASGFIEDARRNGGEATLKFGGGKVLATLHDSPAGWTGEVTEAGVTHKASLSRR